MELNGKKILVVEDETLISMLFEEILAELDCEVIGPAFNLRQAAELARSAEIDAAILDVNLAGEPIYPVAEILAGRKIPVVFSSGYGSVDLSDDWQQAPMLPKPFTSAEVASALRRSIADKG